MLTHKYWGYLIFLAVLFAVFQTIFSFASYPMDLIDKGFGAVATLINNNLPNGVFKELLVNGVLARTKRRSNFCSANCYVICFYLYSRRQRIHGQGKFYHGQVNAAIRTKR